MFTSCLCSIAIVLIIRKSKGISETLGVPPIKLLVALVVGISKDNGLVTVWDSREEIGLVGPNSVGTRVSSFVSGLCVTGSLVNFWS
jgi:hypothetical protein